MRHHLLSILFCLAILNGFSQHEQNYEPLESQGTIPADFISMVSENYENDISEKIDGSETGFEKRSKDEFVKASYSFLQEILGSGKVLFGDEITLYLNEIKDELLKNDPVLKQKVRIYTLKSSIPNAMATDPGIIFVTTSLLARLDNEAQLAYILSHEIAHVIKNHSIDGFVEDQKIIKAKEKYRHNSYQQAVLAMSSFSQMQEYEADHHGAEIYLTTAYAHQEMPKVFEILSYSDFPFENVPFNYAALETSKYKLADSLKLKSVKKIEAADTIKDVYSTHPNSNDRQEKINTLIAEKETSGTGELFLISEEKFKRIKELSRFETIRLNLMNGEYVRAISNIATLQKKYPDNYFLQAGLAKAFYGIYKHKYYWETAQETEGYETDTLWQNMVLGDTALCAGEEQRTVHLLSQFSTQEMRVFALKLFMDANKTGQSNYASFEINILEDLITYEGFEPSQINDSDNSEYRFLSDLPSLEKIHQEAKTQLKENEAIQLDSANRKLFKKQEKWMAESGDYLGFEKIITVTPYYLKTSERKGDNYLGSEEMQLNFTETIRENSEKVGLENEILNPLLFNESAQESFNDLAIINEWLLERMSTSEIDMIPLSTDFLSEEVQKYGTSKLYYTGVINEITRKGAAVVVADIMLAGLVFPLAPIFVYHAINPNHETLTFTVVADMSTGTIDYIDVTFFEKQMDAPIFIDSQVYNRLYKIKNQPKRPMPTAP